MWVDVMGAAVRAASQGSPEGFLEAAQLAPLAVEEDHAGAGRQAVALFDAMGPGLSAVAARYGAGEVEASVRAVERALLACAPTWFEAYMLYMEWCREPQRRFYLPRRAVLGERVVPHLQDLADGAIDFLSISMPPRTGKSTLCIFFLTWVMGRNPTHANVMSGHSDKLTAGFHQEALSIVGTPEYRFADVFPDAPLVAKSMVDETISLAAEGRYPSLTCRPVGGTLTGAVEVGRDSLLYLDDLVSDREEALNPVRMEKLYNAYLNQLKDRMKEGARQLAVATRWVPDDPIGRIEAEYGHDPRYRFVSVPALDAEGRSNFEYGFGVGFSKEYYEDMRRSLVAAGEGDSWDAKYMCDPRPKDGLMFDPRELRRWESLPEGEPDAVLAACDTKDRGADYVAMPVCYVYGDDHYMVEAVCEDTQPEVFKPHLARALARHGVQRARFESNAAGGATADDVGRMAEGMGACVRIEKVYSTSNKETRILADSDGIKQRVLFPADLESASAGTRAFMAQLERYTVKGRVPHDDAPDAMSMYCRHAKSLAKAKVEAVRRIL